MKKPYKPGEFYQQYKWMITVTYNSNSPQYHQVGGRGLSADWSHGQYKEFESWIRANLGPRPSNMVLNRKDKEFGFIKTNLEWATASRRSNSNCQCNKTTHYENRAQSQSLWSKELGIPYWTFRRRLEAGQTIDTIIEEFKK